MARVLNDSSYGLLFNRRYSLTFRFVNDRVMITSCVSNWSSGGFLKFAQFFQS